jgi:nanoRNase/pAp phosphatase (c-di-AMP/oligoRNAs hydrolase)
VSEIAKGFGGGGHKKSAGFTLEGDANIEDLFENEGEDIVINADIIPQIQRENSHGSST